MQSKDDDFQKQCIHAREGQRPRGCEVNDGGPRSADRGAGPTDCGRGPLDEGALDRETSGGTSGGVSLDGSNVDQSLEMSSPHGVAGISKTTSKVGDFVAYVDGDHVASRDVPSSPAADTAAARTDEASGCESQHPSDILEDDKIRQAFGEHVTRPILTLRRVGCQCISEMDLRLASELPRRLEEMRRRSPGRKRGAGQGVGLVSFDVDVLAEAVYLRVRRDVSRTSQSFEVALAEAESEILEGSGPLVSDDASRKAGLRDVGQCLQCARGTSSATLDA